MRLQLLPDNPDIGKAPYVWLIYLGFFILSYGTHSSTWPELGAGTAALLIFLLLYFRCYWVDGAALWLCAIAITAIGVTMARANVGASVFFIYSACAGANFARARDGVLLIAFNALVGLLVALVWQLGWSFGVTSVVLPIVFGGTSLYASQISRARSALLRKQDEIEHLTKIAERERIARDMHDVLGHSLSVVVLKSELARRLVVSDPQRAMRELEDVESTARQALSQVREAISGYRSAGWQAEVEQARNVLEAAAIEVELDLQVSCMAPAAENTLALALREAVTNILRHAGAKRCGIALQQVGSHIVCRITDDGVGVPTAHFGNGLTGMRERVEALGGSMTLSSNHPGLTLQLSLPGNPP